MPGRSPHAGTYHGQDAVLDVLHRGSSATPTASSRSLGIDDILASDTHAASLVRWRVRRGATARSRSTGSSIYRIEDGRIAEIWVHDWDQYAYDELFADGAPTGEPAGARIDPTWRRPAA